MATKKILYIDLAGAIWLHFDVMRSWVEVRVGVDDRNLLESALARPKHASLYDNADIVTQAASLCFGLIKNHPWIGGNKRTATHIVEAFLGINGYRIEYDRNEILEMVLAVESDRWRVDEIENWLRERVNKIG